MSNPWFMFGATVAAAAIGILSAVGIFMQEKYKHEQVKHKVERDFARINDELNAMKRELEKLKSKQKHKTDKKKGNKSNTKSSSIVSTTSDDYTSALDIDSSDVEFYDVSDDEELSLANGITTTSLDKVYKEIDSILDSDNITETKDAITQLHDLCMNYKEADLYWRLGRAYYIVAIAEDDQASMMANIEKGLIACDEALALDENSADSHKWYALLIGRRSEYLPLGNRIKDGHVFKEHIDKAIKLNPSDSTLYHLLGRFSYEIANLKWYERKAASTLFAELPTATYDEALDNFMQADRLAEKEWKENKLFIGKCYVALSNYKEGVKWLHMANDITDTDAKVNEEVQSLLRKYNNRQ